MTLPFFIAHPVGDGILDAPVGMYSDLHRIKKFAEVEETDMATIEEMLNVYYSVNYPVDEVEIPGRLELLESVWKVRSERKQRVLHRGMTELCKDHGRIGFLAV